MIDNLFNLFHKPQMKKASFIAIIIISCVAVGILFRILFVMGMNAYSINEAKNGKFSVSHYTSMIQLYTGDFMEPYVAYYNAGTSAAQHKNYPLAEALLANSLQRVDNDTNECFVRNNLSLVYVEQGNFYKESEMPTQAVTYYDKAITTIQDSPAVCFPPTAQQPAEGEEEGDQGDKPSESQNNDAPLSPRQEAGKQMEETEESSQQQKEELEGQKTDNSEGKETLEEEFNQSKADADNNTDQKKQEANTKPSVDRPW